MRTLEQTLVEYFQTIDDYREDHNKKHVLVDILVIIVCGAICGANNFVEINTVANAKRAWFQTFLALPNGIPSHDTLNRVMARVHPTQFQRCFQAWVRASFPHLAAGHIALDGKELSHSQDMANDYANVRMITAWSVTHGIVLGQEVVADESNEITAAPALLELIDTANCHFTADAQHCQVKFTDTLMEHQAGFTIGVKANQKHLYERIQAIICRQKTSSSASLQTHTTTEKSHGRIEKRAYTFTNDIREWDTSTVWRGIQGIGMVESERWIGEKYEQETRYYIHRGSSTVQEFAQYVRGHWSIENQLHWRLDVIFHEDGAHLRVNHAAENMAIIRHIAINLLTNERTMKVGTNAKRLKAACDNQYLEKVIMTPITIKKTS
jgi:predicted transposase YbfD/YdcC